MQRHYDEFSRGWRKIASTPAMVRFAKRDSKREERRAGRLDAVDEAQRQREEYADEYEEHEHDRICISHPSAPDCWVFRSRAIMKEEFDD
jgi:hypothetical protein